MGDLMTWKDLKAFADEHGVPDDAVLRVCSDADEPSRYGDDHEYVNCCVTEQQVENARGTLSFEGPGDPEGQTMRVYLAFTYGAKSWREDRATAGEANRGQ